jgi:hypothetical protein
MSTNNFNMANFSHNMPDTLTKDVFTKKTDVDIQALEVTVQDIAANQATMTAQLGGITLALHTGPPSDSGSIVSNMSMPPAHLYDTGKICFVNSQTEHGWFVVYKKKEHLKTMYTYRGDELKCLSSAQIRSLKDSVEQESLFGKV